MLKLIIPGIPPSINQWRNFHHHKEARLKKEWEELVVWEVIRQKIKPSQPLKRAETTYTYHFPDKRRRDASNYSGAVKWIEDGLVKAGVLEDDSFDNVILRVERGEPDKENPRVEITIQEVESDAS